MPYKLECCSFEYTENQFFQVKTKLLSIKIRVLPMTFKAAFFDLDGTLLNTLDDLADSANAALMSCHFPVHPTDSYRYFVGDGMRTLIERILPAGSSEKNILECEDIFKKTYGAHWADKTCIYQGVEAMLTNLRSMRRKLAVLSNKPDEFTRMCVQKYFPSDWFDCVRGHCNDVPKKPDPAGALIIVEKLGLQPEDILYVGDTATDMKTGKRAGMKTAGVLWGFREIVELEENGADYIVGTPQEIVQLCQ
jgi:phosphoglycolate phosphatase